MLQFFNHRHNRKVPLEKNTVINGQGLGEVSRMRYGFFPMSYNGCEMIALHNSIVLLGGESDLSEVCREMYMRCQALSGLFGSVPTLLGSFYRRRGIPYRMTRGYDDFFDNLDRTPVSVVSFWNMPKRPWNGIHTVTIQSLGSGSFRIYNRSNRSGEPVDYGSREEFIPKKSYFICGYLIREDSDG